MINKQGLQGSNQFTSAFHATTTPSQPRPLRSPTTLWS